MSTFQGIRPGDRVTFVTPQGQTCTGRAKALLCFADHVVVDCGGPYGRPAVVNASNFVRVARKGR